MKRLLPLLFALLLACSFVLAEGSDDLGVQTLTPTVHAAQTDGATPTALYCGPTQGAYRHDELMFNPCEPYVYFGQYDCWSMVASGTPEHMGPIGWVETAAIDAPKEPILSFTDALPVMIEEDTFLTDKPDVGQAAKLFDLPCGTQVILLARYGDWGYAQCEMGNDLLRAFFPLSAVL